MIKKLATLIIGFSLGILSPLILPLFSDTKPPEVKLYGDKMDLQALYASGALAPAQTNYSQGYPGLAPLNNNVPGGGGVLGASTNTPNNITTTPVVDQNLLGQYDQRIGQIGTQQGLQDSILGTGNRNINNSYDSALQQLLQGYNVANRGYGEAKQGAALDYVGAKNTIGSQAGASLNGLQRLLGSRGAGGSSAYNIAAPQAVARGASLQRADVSGTNAQNMRGIDQNWGDYTNNYNQEVSSAGTQRDRARQDLEGTIANNRISLLNSLAGLQSERASAAGGNPVAASQGSLNAANALAQQTANYITPQISYNTQAYQAPSLASYNTAPQPTAQFNQAGGDYVSPYLSALLGKKQLGTV